MANRRTRPQTRGTAKREAILAAAWSVFRESGYPNASMDEITRRAGGSKVSVYAHFGSKAALFDAVVRRQAELVAASYSIARPTSNGLEDSITALARAVVAGMTSAAVKDLHRVALSAAPAVPSIGKLLYEHGTLHVIRAAARMLAARMRAGDLLIDDPVIAAEVLFGLLLGTAYIRFALGLPDRLSASAKRERITRAVEVFLAAYRPTHRAQSPRGSSGALARRPRKGNSIPVTAHKRRTRP